MPAPHSSGFLWMVVLRKFSSTLFSDSRKEIRRFGVRRALFVLPLCAVAIVSCSTGLKRFHLLSDTASKGNYLKCVKDIRKAKKLYGDNNRFLYFMDQGVLFHYAEEYDSSLYFFETAEKVLDDLYARSITNEAAALLTNDLLRPYPSKRYEEVLLHQLMSFDYLGKNKPDEALVETRKFQLIVDRFKSKDGRASTYEDDGMVQYFSSIVYGEQGFKDDAAISLFNAIKAFRKSPVEPPKQVLDQAFYLFKDLGRSEDINQLSLSSSTPKENVWGFSGEESEIILVGYAGRGPDLGQVTFAGTYVVGGFIVGGYSKPDGEFVHVSLPAPLLPESEMKKLEEGKKNSAGTTFHIKFALPVAMSLPSQTARFSVSVDNASSGVESVVLANNDALLLQDVSDNMDATLVRTAIRVVIRTIAAQKAKQKMETASPLANFLLNVGTDVLSDQLEKADTRVCFLVPKTIQIARIAVKPGMHRVEAFAQNSSGGIVGKKTWETLDVRPNEKKFIFFPSLM